MIVTTTADSRVRFDANINANQTSVEVGSHGASYATNMFRSAFVMPDNVLNSAHTERAAPAW